MKKERKKEEVLMRYLGNLYQKYDEDKHIPMQEVTDNKGIYNGVEFLIDMNRILHELPQVYEEIIRNDFLCVKEQDWWKNKYDKETHEQLKNIAVEAFFHCLYT